MLSVYMVFAPDVEQVSTTYLTGWLIVMYLGYTMMAIAHQSWGAELAPDYSFNLPRGREEKVGVFFAQKIPG